MGKNFELKGYTIITSLSHGLLGPLKLKLESLKQMSGSDKVFMGSGQTLAGFPKPEKTILAPGCTRQALYDSGLPPEEGYRKIFGDRVMLEVQAFVDRIPPGQVRFRDESRAEEIDDKLQRIIDIFNAMGKTISQDEISQLHSLLGEG